jgi:hypothetical protein
MMRGYSEETASSKIAGTVALGKFVGVVKARRRSWLAELVQCSIA